MTPDTLKSVIDAESAIQAMLEAERQRAEKWLKNVEAEAGEAAQQEIARLEDKAMQKDAAARQEARARAEETVRLAAARADRMDNLREKGLRDILRPFLHRLLPEKER